MEEASPLRKKPRRSPAPIYAFGLAWLAYAMLMPLYSLGQLITCFIFSLVVSLVVGRVSASRRKAAIAEMKKEEAVKQPEPAKATSYGPEIDAIIAEGQTAQREMGRLYASIKEPKIRAKINQLMQISDKIVQDAIHDPSDVPQIKKFLSYYLPTTIKLLNAYDRMSDQGIEGENITGTMSRIEDMLDTAVEAYKKQLDSLFANQALDIETDIHVMNAMLEREGLSGTGASGFPGV